MLESYLIKGLLVGLVFGVPAGAVGALTIQRSLTHGFAAGFATGLGSSVADVLYACIGVLGLTMISDFLLAHQSLICMAGCALIILLGVMIFRKRGEKAKDSLQRVRFSLCFGSAFTIAVANPATILSFFVAFSSFGIAAKPTFDQGSQLVLGILIGTCCWWGLLSGIVSVFRTHITDDIYQKLNRILGCLMVLFGIIVGVRTFL